MEYLENPKNEYCCCFDKLGVWDPQPEKPVGKIWSRAATMSSGLMRECRRFGASKTGQKCLSEPWLLLLVNLGTSGRLHRIHEWKCLPGAQRASLQAGVPPADHRRVPPVGRCGDRGAAAQRAPSFSLSHQTPGGRGGWLGNAEPFATPPPVVNPAFKRRHNGGQPPDSDHARGVGAPLVGPPSYLNASTGPGSTRLARYHD